SFPPKSCPDDPNGFTAPCKTHGSYYASNVAKTIITLLMLTMLNILGNNMQGIGKGMLCIEKRRAVLGDIRGLFSLVPFKPHYISPQRLDQFFHVVGQRTFETGFFRGGGVDEFEFLGVQRLALEGEESLFGFFGQGFEIAGLEARFGGLAVGLIADER